MRYWLVMPAAGAGRRFGSAKQFAPMGARSMLEIALQCFAADPQCVGGSIVLAPEEPRREELAAQLPPRFALIEGGAQRADSVINGLRGLKSRAAASDWVLVHDAARPCLSAQDLSRLLASARDASDGALLAAPVADTVKQAQSATPGQPARCGATIPRETLWLAQTPQMFRYEPLLGALERARAAGRVPTDEAQAMEWEGVCAQLIEARDSNIKVTSASDLGLAIAILSARERA
ncbi:MAG: 2-C-methyl-D-erythritol 4-phosphate cytidylyltransferase [Steroidobacteraceae bacterium]|jgi:2-C-methyl-D-erythritol 4-phosphate cytidylyltransferase